MAVYFIHLPACPVYSEAQVNLNMSNLETAYISLSFIQIIYIYVIPPVLPFYQQHIQFIS